jgi:leucine dehydrogenase
VYAPDFVINAGGLINVAAEREPGGYNEARVLAEVRNIARTVCRVLDTAQHLDISTQRAALQLAERRLAQQHLAPTA